MTIEPKYVIILLRIGFVATKVGQAMKHKYAIKRITALFAGAARIAGDNRYATRVAVNEKFADILTGDMLCVATGSDFPDALAAFMQRSKKRQCSLFQKPSPSSRQTT